MVDLAIYNDVAKQSTNRDAVILQHIGLVKRIAYHLKSRMPDSVQIDDLLQSGMVGLIEASHNFKTDKGASFETYAGTRIRGAMIDYVRKNNWIPRSVTQNSKKISEAIASLERETKQQATPEAIAKQLGVSISEYHQMLKDVGSMELFSIDEQEGNLNADDENETPHIKIELQDLKQSLVQEIKLLPEKEQLVLSLYYYEELNFKEIAEVLGVSESRVSQIHGQSISRIREKVGRSLC